MKNIFLFAAYFVLSNCLSQTTTEAEALSSSAMELIDPNIVYDGSYFSIPYPNGDIPSDKGVCTDVIIRAFRKIDIDLQKEVHEDMKANFGKYPKLWGLRSTDRNIDHRRVPNLMVYFQRQGYELPITNEPTDYLPGDIVAWSLGGAITHIGILVDQKSRDGRRHLIVHNIGAGQLMEDLLFKYEIIGHFRLNGK